VITVAFAVVAFAIVVQGLTMTLLLRRLGEIGGLPETGTRARDDG
jgi:NhaP-type Na+/H+ or K+/H+ antiporter